MKINFFIFKILSSRQFPLVLSSYLSFIVKKNIVVNFRKKFFIIIFDVPICPLCATGINRSDKWQVTTAKSFREKFFELPNYRSARWFFFVVYIKLYFQKYLNLYHFHLFEWDANYQLFSYSKHLSSHTA